ncbi:MAG: ABC transporter permease [Candidatus Heimdallarchaeota archaeon]|nr:ABC transporter permease [Candidatus Heimdallarchaeota archaeon]
MEKSSWFFNIAMVIINALILYLIFEDQLFLWIFIGSIIVFGIFVLRSLITRILTLGKSIDKMETPHTGGFLDGIKLSKKYLTINKKYTFTSIIGLLLAILVISQVLIINSSFRQTSFNQYIQHTNTTGYEFQIDHVDNQTFLNWEEYVSNNLNRWEHISESQIKSFDSIGKIRFNIYLGEFIEQEKNESWANYILGETRLWTEEYYQVYSGFPSFPGFSFDPNDRVLIIPSDLKSPYKNGTTTDYDTNEFIISESETYSFEILTDFSKHNIINGTMEDFNKIRYNVDKVWQLTDEDIGYLKNSQILLPISSTWFGLFSSNGDEWDLYQNLLRSNFNTTLPDFVWGKPGISGQIRIEIKDIKDQSLDTQMIELTKLITQVDEDISQFIENQEPHIPTFQISFKSSAPLSVQFNRYTSGTSDLNRAILMTSLPLVLISLFLLYFSLTLIEKRKEKLFGQMLIRGSSIFQVRGMLLVEIIFSSLIATAVGMVLSVPISSLFLKSSGLLEFNNPSTTLVIPANWIWRLPLIGMLLAIDFNMISINNIAKLEIEEAVSSVSNKKPFWIRMNLDLVLFLLSGVFWLIILNFKINFEYANLIYSIIAPIMLVITLIGFPLVIGRYFIQFLEKLVIFSKLRFDMLTLAIHNINKNKQFTTQLVALLLTGMMLSFMGLVMTQTMSEVSDERAKYSLGSDIYVEGLDIDDPINDDKLDIDGVAGFSYSKELVYTPDRIELPIGQNENDIRTTHILGVNPDTFPRAAFWMDDYADLDLVTLMRSLGSLRDAFFLRPAIIERTTAEALNMEIGDRLSFSFGFQGRLSTSFTIAAFVDYFPRFITEIPTNNLDNTGKVQDIFIITRLVTTENLDAALSFDSISTGAYVKIEESADITQVAEALNANFIDNEMIKVVIYTNEIISLLQSLESQGELAKEENEIFEISLHSILLITFIVNIVGMGYYSFSFTSDRQKELGIYRALGMKRRQITNLLFYEILLIVLSSIIFGMLAGIFVSYITLIMIVGGGVQIVPPISLVFPQNPLMILAATTTIAALVLAFIPVFLTTRKQTANILRAQ